MDLLFSKEWWKIILIVGSFFSFIGILAFVLSKLKTSFKIKDFSFGSKDLTNIPFKLKHSDYLMFCLLFRDIQYMLKARYRVWCIENGILNMNDSEWFNYKKERVDQLCKTFIQFMTENYSGVELSLDDFDKEYQLNENMIHYFDQIFDDVRIIAKEIETQASTLTVNLNTFMDVKSKEVESNPTVSNVLSAVLSSGKKMIEIHELQNRTLLRRQMQKIEEIHLNFYNDSTFKFLTLLNRKLKDSSKDK